MEEVMSENLTKAEALKFLVKMMEIRKFEDKIMDLLAQNIAEGGSHLYAGEEAVAAGAMAAIKGNDYITSTHRGHGHCIAKGGKLDELMAEILGKKTGCCKGKGGSLHLADMSTYNLGANGVVGGGFGIATGAGLSIKMRKTDQVVLCFFGDGASNQGLFHECANMAGVWKLPVVYICENNLYGMSVALKRASAVEDLTKKAVPYGMPSNKVDGQDVVAVRDAVLDFVKYAREGNGPSLLVCDTYRYYGHSRSDPRVYRTKEEEKFWQEKDPIKLFANRCISKNILTESDVNGADKDVTDRIEAATKFAIDSPLPDPHELFEDLFAPVEGAK
jgi:TPP-dependent pyruvate/acetoin dehydrogenase alpha subunit